MPALVAGIHVFLQLRKKGVDGRDEPGHDGDSASRRRLREGACRSRIRHAT
jgi:hypothetical protein